MSKMSLLFLVTKSPTLHTHCRSQTLCADAICLAHVGHQGIVKTKSLIRVKIWFPLIDSLVKAKIDACIPCQATGCPKAPQPLQMHEISKENFDTVYIDFLGPLPSGETLFVLIDGHSRYPVTKIMKKTDGSHLILFRRDFCHFWITKRSDF